MLRKSRTEWAFNESVKGTVAFLVGVGGVGYQTKMSLPGSVLVLTVLGASRTLGLEFGLSTSNR